MQAHGITLSRAQFEYTQQRIRAEGLQHLVTAELCDYRDLAGQGVYDKVSSVGMFEHVGLANLPTYLETVRRVLRPGGLFLCSPRAEGAANTAAGKAAPNRTPSSIDRRSRFMRSIISPTTVLGHQRGRPCDEPLRQIRIAGPAYILVLK